MTTKKNIMIISLLLIFVSVAPAQMVTKDNALKVANNWIDLIIQKKGHWGGSETATVADVQTFRQAGRKIGYFCRVNPQGYIIVSLRKELAPVKAYSATCDLNPECEAGLADLIKSKMRDILDHVEKTFGPLEKVRSEDLQPILQIDYRPNWKRLENRSFDTINQAEGDIIIETDYQEGEWLLTSNWHQGAPYYDQCPEGDSNCIDCDISDPCDNNPASRTVVGCVATAGAQIMRYWNWPPYGEGVSIDIWDGDDSCEYPICGGSCEGETFIVDHSDSYDWPHMANDYINDNNNWVDENGDPLSSAHLDAVIDLCYETAIAVDMDFGVCGSSASNASMVNAYEGHFRYSDDCKRESRSDYPLSVLWFYMLQEQFNANRPVQYIYPGHSLVADGWQIVDDNNMEIHLNYGWGRGSGTRDGCNTWYGIDAIYSKNPHSPDEEGAIIDIYPEPALNSAIAGTYLTPASFPYRYFVQDTTVNTVTFEAGHNLQFLPGVIVKDSSPVVFSRILGESGDTTRLFSIKGTSSGGKVVEAKIYDGEIRLYNGGGIRFH